MNITDLPIIAPGRTRWDDHQDALELGKSKLADETYEYMTQAGKEAVDYARIYRYCGVVP